MEQEAFRIQETFHLPKWHCLVARRVDGQHVCSMRGGEWFTRDQFEARLIAERVKDAEKQKDLARFDEAVEATKLIYGMNGPVGKLH